MSDHPADAAPPAPFAAFTPALNRAASRAAITAATRTPEPELMPGLVELARQSPADAEATQALAMRIAANVRNRARDSGRAGLVQSLLQEFALSSQEGVALMCLAEALLRVPDAATRDALIRDKISAGNWQSHLGQSPSLFVNAATWGLLLTGKLVATHSDLGLGSALKRIVGRGGEPLIRKGVDMAMRMMGEQFVTGETIAQALENARPREAEGFRYSYDMLGEAALTADDAARYLAAYEQAIAAIGAASAGRGIYEGPGISIKLSALHPRYSRAQAHRVIDELYPRVLHLVQRAQAVDIGINIDAEESDRLDLSLELLERLLAEPGLAGWMDVGFVVQAYLKRCPQVIDHLIALTRSHRRRLMVRLVKGAYWDAEIKRAQLDGQAGYPVYTRKAHTDVAYLACARKLLAAPEAVYPQFATHNAHTLAAITRIAGQNYYAGQYEFQCLHGMGEPLYEQVVGSVADGKLGRPCRIYAPVGTHETLLAYLVRRLLENGSNSSFVNRIANEEVPLAELVEDPIAHIERLAAQEGRLGLGHPAIPLPVDLYGRARRNSMGMDLTDEARLAELSDTLFRGAAQPCQAGPMLAADASGAGPGKPLPVLNPADQRDVVGQVAEADAAQVAAAVAAAQAAAPAWAATPPAERAALLERAAEALEAQMDALIGLLVREAGKTAANAVAEVREAVDFLRYDATQVREAFDNATHRPLGPVVCISPWNFPLAIFTGQVAAALAAGNTVLAKPAEQTPLVAAQAVQALWSAGVPRAVLQLLPGRGETVGAALVADERVQGVLFTGSTEVARLLQRGLAGRLGAHGKPVPLIAETGGQNALIVDSSALVEQVVLDVLNSAFDSAGQRCSALRVLCVQREAADRVIAMLEGAMRELRLGAPDALATDVGPVIDAEARQAIQRHVDAMRLKGRRVVQASLDVAPLREATRHGTFVPPTLIEIESMDELTREVFGPVLHVLRYDRDALPALMDAINATGYGLTMGLHTRIDETIAQVVAQARAGNLYVNRNMVGAVVGVQPFGGEGLSGTGPKAGGPLYLLRLLAARPADAARRAVQASGGTRGAPPVRGLRLGHGAHARVAPSADAAMDPALRELQAWAEAEHHAEHLPGLAGLCGRFAEHSPVGPARVLTGPTGEANLYAVLPREAVLCLADEAGAHDADRLAQLAAVLAVGSHALMPSAAAPLCKLLPDEVRDRVSLVDDWAHPAVRFDAVLFHGSADNLRRLNQALTGRPGPVIVAEGHAPGDHAIALERLVHERSLSINTAAAGGNATLMTIG